MTRPLKFALVILSALFAVIVAALFVVLPIVSTPSFKVHNASYQPVEVIAYWRDQSRALGLLKPGKIIRFRLNDEAAMKFMVRFSNGTEKTSDKSISRRVSGCI